MAPPPIFEALPGAFLGTLIIRETTDDLYDQLKNIWADMATVAGATTVSMPCHKHKGNYDFIWLKNAEEESKPLVDEALMLVEVKVEGNGQPEVIRVSIRKDCMYLIGFCTKEKFYELCSIDKQWDKQVKVEGNGQPEVIRVSIRKDCMYLIGFCTKEKFYELCSIDKQWDNLLRGAQLMNIGADHAKILGINEDNRSHAVSSRFHIDRLKSAVKALSRAHEKVIDPHDVGLLVVMIIEAYRLPKIQKAIQGERSMTLQSLEETVKEWDDISQAMSAFRLAKEEAEKSDPNASIIPDTPYFPSIAAARVKIRVVHESNPKKIVDANAKKGQSSRGGKGKRHQR